MGSPPRSLNERVWKTAFPPQSLLDPFHVPGVAAVVVTEEVKEPMESQHAEFGCQRVTREPGLTKGYTDRDDDIAYVAGRRGLGPGGGERELGVLGCPIHLERQHVRYAVQPPEAPVQTPHALVADQRHRDLAFRRRGCDPREPPRQALRWDTPAASVRHDDAQAGRSHRHDAWPGRRKAPAIRGSSRVPGPPPRRLSGSSDVIAVLGRGGLQRCRCRLKRSRTLSRSGARDRAARHRGRRNRRTRYPRSGG